MTGRKLPIHRGTFLLAALEFEEECAARRMVFFSEKIVSSPECAASEEKLMTQEGEGDSV